MQLDRFKHEFKRLNGVYATDKVVLFRNPLELYSLTTGKIIASFNSLDEALHFEIDGRPLSSGSAHGRRSPSPWSTAGVAAVPVSVLAAAGRPLVAAAARTKPPQTYPRA